MKKMYNKIMIILAACSILQLCSTITAITPEEFQTKLSLFEAIIKHIEEKHQNTLRITINYPAYEQIITTSIRSHVVDKQILTDWYNHLVSYENDIDANLFGQFQVVTLNLAMLLGFDELGLVDPSQNA